MRFIRSFSFLLVILGSCVSPYEPELKNESFDILVVDGFINSTDNSATVRLSKAVAVTDDTPVSQQIAANVNIEDEAGSTYTLNDMGQGLFSAENLSLDQSRKYRLHIFTPGDSEIFSDYIELTTTPPIDSVVWKPATDGIKIYANTHDPSGSSRYYSWEFEETWEYVSSFFSTYELVNGEAIPRLLPEDWIYYCWSTERSTRILIASTTKLSDDVVNDFPVTFVPGESNKLGRRYSILVKQRVISPEAYEFWTQLAKTTESLGGLFDPLPSQVLGNIRSNNQNSAHPVLGYFSGGSVAQQRLFVDFVDLPEELTHIYRLPLCKEEEKNFIPVGELRSQPPQTLLVDPVYVQGVGIVGYTSAANMCIDCRLFGGTTKRPDFW